MCNAEFESKPSLGHGPALALGYSREEGRGGNVIQLDKWPVTLLA